MKTRISTPRSARRSQTTVPDQKSETHNEIVDWLRDAYGMERGLEHALQKQAFNDELSPATRQRAAIHLKETQRHAAEVAAMLEGLGTKTSPLKTSVGRIAQASKGLMTKFARDERIKDLLDSYAMEHFEIACYTALAAAAERSGLLQVAEMCWRIIPDEEVMARSIRDALPDEIALYLFDAEAEFI